MNILTDDGARLKVKGSQVITIHPEGIMNACTKFHGSPSKSCLDISLKTKCQPNSAEEMLGDL